MYEQRKKQVSYLTLLLYYTCFLVILTVESVLLGWERGVVLQLLAGLVICWALHITKKVPEELKRWFLFFMTMAAFVFYGMHDTSFYDLAPVMLGVILAYFAAGMYSMIDLCMAVYFAVMVYDMIFVVRDSLELTPLTVSRILLHFITVFLAARLTKYITARQGREGKEIDERIARLEETSSRMEDFLTNVSHELRTPINAVTGLTAVMLKNRENDADRENLLSVQMAGHRLFRQIEDILDFTEIDTGRITNSEEDYMISSLINDCISEIGMLETGKGLELIFDVDAEIPAVLHGDARKIKKIIKHLLDNARKFTSEGGCCVRIYGIRKTYGINLCIKVSDTGIGMDKENLEKVKEKFFQSSGGRARKAGGLGLGLPIVYGMAAAMEGFVHVESREGGGTDVTVSIPQKIVDDTRCMAVEKPGELCLACYLKPEKYRVPKVRKFYDEMISHIASGLDTTVHRVFNMDEMEKLVGAYRLTHLFLAKEEYEEDPGWFEGLDREIQVVLVSDPGYRLPEGSRVRLMAKPFCCFPVVSILNAVKDEEEEERHSRMICPGVRVLVVDDEPMNRMVAEGIFRDYGMQVKTAGSGAESIEICGKEDFDLIFMDHMMPQMDGIEALKHLRRLKADSKEPFVAIAFTANAVSGAREMFLKEGFDEFVSKPVETIELERVLRKVLPKSRIRYAENGEDIEREPEGRPEADHGAEPAAADVNTKGSAAGGELAPFEEIGFCTEAGLSYCRSNQTFYLQMLAVYGQEAEQKADALNDLYRRKDYGNYRIQVHALKSNSRLVGADSLSEMARQLEEAAKREDASYIEEHHQELMDAYTETARRVREILGQEKDGPDGETESDEGTQVSEAAPLTGEELLSRLEELQGSLDTYESDTAGRLIESLAGNAWQGKPVKELLREVEQAVEQFEFETASEKLAALKERVKEGEAG